MFWRIFSILLQMKKLSYTLPVAGIVVLLIPHAIGVNTAHADTNDDIPDLHNSHIITDLTPYKKEEYFDRDGSKIKDEVLEFRTIDNTHCLMHHLTVWCDTDSSQEYPSKHLGAQVFTGGGGDVELAPDDQSLHDYLFAKGQTLLPENSSLIFPTPKQGVKPTICTTTQHSLTCYIQNTYGPKGNLTDDTTIRGFTISPTHSHTFTHRPNS